MPSLPNPIALLALKLGGYTVAGAVLNRVFKKEVFPPLFGIVRAFSGLALGLITIPLATYSPNLWLVGLRIAVWYFLIRFFYRSSDASNKVFYLAVLGGVVYSFILDGVLVLLSFLIPGSWIKIPWF
jgi:hypothetical protein